MKRPGIVWVFTILIGIGIIWELFDAILFFGGLGKMTTISILITILGLILLIPRGIMIAKFFMLQKSALTWVHISYGLILALSVIQYIIFFATVGPLGIALVAPPSLLLIGIYILFWWAVADYIKKKQINDQPVFN